MATRGAKARTPLLAILGGAVLLVGFVIGWLSSQQSCARKSAPPTEHRREPDKPKRPERASPALPKAKATAQADEVRSSTPTDKELPRLALVIDDLGYASPELVTRLCAQPVPFSVAVLPYQEFTRESARIAREAGKELMLHLPMEPHGYPGPGKDPGPDAVMFNLTEREVRDRVKKALADVPRAKGVNNHMGSRITPDRLRMGWVLDEVKAARCFFVDSRTEKDSVAFEIAQKLGIPSVERKVFLDDEKAYAEMEKQWDRAVAIARKEGQVLIIGHIYPETVQALERLIPRSKGDVSFVKASALTR